MKSMTCDVPSDDRRVAFNMLLPHAQTNTITRLRTQQIYGEILNVTAMK